MKNKIEIYKGWEISKDWYIPSWFVAYSMEHDTAGLRSQDIDCLKEQIDMKLGLI